MPERVSITFADVDASRLIPLELDAVPEERHSAAATATENEVEVGVNITDHVRPSPRTLVLRVIVSDSTIGPDGGSNQPVELSLPRRQVQALSTRSGGRPRAGAIRDEQPSQTFGLTFTPDVVPTRVADAWRVLQDARARSLLAIVTTPLETYRPMALLNVETVRTARDFSWLDVSLTFKEIHHVATETVDDPVPARVRDRRPVDRGFQGATPMPARMQSTIDQGIQGRGSLGFLQDVGNLL